MADFERSTELFDVVGLNLSRPVDRMGPGRYRLLSNVRPYGQGRVQGRQGTTLVSLTGTTGDPAHSLYTFDDPLPSPSQFPGAFTPRCRLLGSGTTLLSARSTTDPTAFTPTVNGTGFSGRPMTFVTSSSDQSERPWTFIGDFTKNQKTSSAGINWQWGVAPPNFAPTAVLDAVNVNGPNVGASPNGYVYALRARTDPLTITGARSNLGPPIRTVNALFPAGQNIKITTPLAHPDQAPTGQVTWLDVFRWGGSLPIWLYVGTIQNIAGSFMIDTFADQDIANNEQASLDDYQPFLSIDGSLTGSASIVSNGVGLGATMFINSGDTLRAYNATGSSPYYIPGNTVTISGQVYTFYRSPDSTTQVELLEDPPGNFVANFLIPAPEMARQTIPCVWGPFGGGFTGTFIFGCGDQLRPGGLYWTKGNDPEVHPTTNVLEITNGSEPLMNGVLYNGNAFVLSTKRMWQILPTLGQISDFSALEIPNSKGLFARWGICTTPHGIAFIGKDGIYLTTGGEPTSLTDTDLYPIFPQESFTSSSGFPIIDGLNGATFSPPDFTQPDAMRLAYGDGYLYFDYLGQDSTRYTLVYNFEQPEAGWISRDTYSPSVQVHYFETVHNESTSGSWSQMLMGTTNGEILKYGGASDSGAAISGHVRTASIDGGDPRPRKLWGDFELTMDGECETFDIKAGFEAYSYFGDTTTTGTNIHGRHGVIGDINAGQGQYASNMGLDITWTSSTSQPILYFWVPSRLSKPEVTALRVTDWEFIVPGGHPRFVQGFRLHADTLGVARSIAVLSDNGVTQQTFTVNFARERTTDFWFDTPFISHMIRLWPQDAQFWRIFGVEWISEPVPPLAKVWKTQNFTHDLGGWGHHRDCYVALISSADVTLTITSDGIPGSPWTYTFANTNGVFQKIYSVLQPMKALQWEYKLTSDCPFRLYVRDTEFRIKAWGSDGPYTIVRPVGDFAHDIGATI